MAQPPAPPRAANRAGVSPAAAHAAARRAPHADPLSAMTERFGFVFRWFAKRFFGHFGLDDATVARLRELEAAGSVVYVMRYASRLDYFLFNVLFLREGLRLSSFANGIRFWYYRPIFEALRILWRRPRGVPQDIELVRTREHARALTLDGASSSCSCVPPACAASCAGGAARWLAARRSATCCPRSCARPGTRSARCTWSRSRCSGARDRAPAGASSTSRTARPRARRTSRRWRRSSPPTAGCT
jgi:hypothetical protein